MKPEQVFRKYLQEWKEISGLDYCLLGPENQVLVNTGSRSLPSEQMLSEFRDQEAQYISDTSCQLYKVSDGTDTLVLILWGKNASSPMIGRLAVCQVESLLLTLAEKNDKSTFLQGLLQNRYEPSEALSLARKLHINASVHRCLFLIETKTPVNDSILSAVKNTSGNRTKDFVVGIEEKRLLLVRELSGSETPEELEEFAYMLVDMLDTEVMVPARLSVGNPAMDLFSLQNAYKEAQTAMEIGKIFYADRKVQSYGRLGIGRLIYQLPVEICEMFLDENFKGNSLDSLDEETLITIRTFFETNLNFSETSRQLYIHRNTLAYRFEKLEKKYGLDIRTFEDAMTFKLAMMVSDYVFHLRNRQHI